MTETTIHLVNHSRKMMSKIRIFLYRKDRICICLLKDQLTNVKIVGHKNRKCYIKVLSGQALILQNLMRGGKKANV